MLRLILGALNCEIMGRKSVKDKRVEELKRRNAA